MKRLVLLGLVLLLCLTSACAYKMKDASPLAAAYQHDWAAGGKASILYLVLQKGTFQITDRANGVLWQGSYKAGSDQLVFSVAQASAAGKVICATGDEFSYRWKYDELAKQLSLEKIEDACATRVSLLAGQAWSLVKTEINNETTPAAEE
jgi:hypothetical protein